MAASDIVSSLLGLVIIVVVGWAFLQAISSLGTIPAIIFGIAWLILIIALLKSFFR